MGVRLAIHDDGDVVVIHAFGKIGSGAGSRSLHARLRQLSEQGHSRFLLNVAGVTSMDSADIGELVAGYAAVVLAGGELKLLNPSSDVEVVLRVTRITQLLDIYGDEAAALWSFSGSRPSRLQTMAGCEPRSEWYFG